MMSHASSHTSAGALTHLSLLPL